ncbi:MAG: sulfite exporter TauE/SafE family protein [Pseudomonadota bacterium]
MSPDALAMIAVATFLFAGMIKGVVGIGLPTASIAILAQVTDPRQAIALLLLPALAANAWQVYRSGRLLEAVREFWPFAAVMTVGIWIFARFAVHVPADVLIIGTGIVIILFALSSLISKPYALPPAFDLSAQLGAGALAGIMGGLTSIWSPPMVIYLLARRLSKDAFVRVTGMLILVGTIPLIIGYMQAGLMTPTLAAYSAMLILPTWLGFAIGEWMRHRLDAEQFRRILLIVFFFMGANLIRRGWF